VRSEDYEIIVVDNGSPAPLDLGPLDAYGVSVTLVRLTDASPSPSRAINHALRLCRGGYIGVMIDGARLASPGIAAGALSAARLGPRVILTTLGFHLGRKPQMQSIHDGYDQSEEDRLLESIDWEANPYGLFKVSALAGSSAGGWFAPIAESNALFMSRQLWGQLGGYEELFECEGGGLVNLDTYVRACAIPQSELLMLLGEGTFHQVHGGVVTNSLTGRWDEFHAEYVRVRGRPFVIPSRERTYFARGRRLRGQPHVTPANARVRPGASEAPATPTGRRPQVAALHVGPMKTGTKFIQHLLRAAAPALAKSGLSVPPSGAAIHAAALEYLQLEPLQHPDIATVFHPGALADLLGWLDGRPEPAVLSSEVLSWFSGDEAAGFAESFGGIGRVLIGTRHYAHLCRSAWGAALRRGRCGDPYTVFQRNFAAAVAERSTRTDWRGASTNRGDRLQYFSLPSLVTVWDGACEQIDLISADEMTDDSLSYAMLAALGIEHAELLHHDLAALMTAAGSDSVAIRHPGPNADEIHAFLDAIRGESRQRPDAANGWAAPATCACADCRSDARADARLHELYVADLAWFHARRS
jgi:hypothetical protein